MSLDTVILDCYTDEPSGYGVRPYLGTHQLHLSQALAAQGRPHAYITIDDLRYCEHGRAEDCKERTDIATLNTTINRDDALDILRRAKIIYVIMGCFVDYNYFSCVPPRSDEVYHYLQGMSARKVLFYVMGTLDGISSDYSESRLSTIIDEVEHGNTYRYVFELAGSTPTKNLINPDYDLLKKIGRYPPPILEQIRDPIIAEIETGTGCNTPTCTFCIESVRSPRVTYREPEDIVEQVECLYNSGVRHFRLGRQPNFFHYMRQDVLAMERLLGGIRSRCPEIRTLHIDNVNIVNVITAPGHRIAELVAMYCTSGNVAPFGIESFDPTVRQAARVVGSVDDIMHAVEIINRYGSDRGENGIPKLLPGINLIHGLPGASARTHEANRSCLLRILGEGLMAYRFYYRNMTQPTGVSLSSSHTVHAEFQRCFDELTEEFVLPMQSRVYPPGTVIKDDWEMVRDDDVTYARTLGTCSIKVRLDQQISSPRASMSVRVVGNIGYRLLEGIVS
jgi:radical SAM superfamily enzyme with C-terminal helix-hairpin-helix motif